MRLLIAACISAIASFGVASFALNILAFLSGLWIDGTGAGEGYVIALIIVPAIFVVCFIWLTIIIFKGINAEKAQNGDMKDINSGTDAN